MLHSTSHPASLDHPGLPYVADLPYTPSPSLDSPRNDTGVYSECPPLTSFSAKLPLHAPIPLPGQSSLLFNDFDYPTPQSPPINYIIDEALLCQSESQGQFVNLDHYLIGPPQPTFPTPSELLSDFAGRPATAASPDLPAEKKSETARKARRRAMTKSVGFEPTDPDSISSHEKKRHYLECLEQYVMYLHQQSNLVGINPIPLERVSNYRGLSSRSIRTLLVHMENTTRKLNVQTKNEEQRFVALRDAVYKYEVDAAQAYQRYPVNSDSSILYG